MASQHNVRDDAEPSFSFGVAELKQAKAAQVVSARQLSIQTAPVKASNEARGSDPYNTSGSFDRKKNWTRVGKR